MTHPRFAKIGPAHAALLALAALPCAGSLAAQTVSSSPGPVPPKSSPVLFSVYGRQRVNATQWFAATPDSEQYGHLDSLLRIAISQRVKRVDYQLELSNNAELFLPADGVSPVAAQGQLGLGGTYLAGNNLNTNPVAASFKTGWLRYHVPGEKATLRVGRFEFLDGTETTPKNTTLLWLQQQRIAQRVIGNFGFSNGQRSLDGVEGKITRPNWDLTAMGARADQGVFNMNANPQLNVDVQYLAYTRYLAQQRVQVRAFGVAYHDGRTGLLKTDNRPMAVRALDHKNIRIGTYGAHAIAAIPYKHTTIDLLGWGTLQNGSWGTQDHRAAAFAVEGGIRFDTLPTKPWLRGGALRSTGDENNADGVHNTYFQVLPTPRNYARFPYFNFMNSSDQFVQLIDKPTSKLDIRTDLHFLQLTSRNDLWYQGGGAFDNKVFGYVGRPANGHNSFSALYDISADYAVSKQLSLTAYYAHTFGKTVVAAIYPRDRVAQYGFLEVDYKFQRLFGKAPKP